MNNLDKYEEEILQSFENGNQFRNYQKEIES